MYDAIVVGARCAGSPTAMLLARAGHRVLLVDRASFPSDSVSTHYIHQPGIARLHRWGLLPRLQQENCPPVREYTLDVGPFALTGTPPPIGEIDMAYSPRRTVLDQLLVEAAADAGVEVRERFAVDELIFEDGRVAGIGGRPAGGTPVTEKARIVIGADGVNSHIARGVGAREYGSQGTLTCAYYTYWDGVEMEGAELYPRPGNMIVAAPTNDGRVVTIAFWPAHELHRVREDIEREFMRVIELAPSLAERVYAGARAEKFRGMSRQPNFFRQPHGDGWALVGDAGHHKDPILALGITDAFRDADLLAEAVDAGLTGRRTMDAALEDRQRRRDDLAAAGYVRTIEFARLQPPPPEMQQLFAALAHDQHQTDRFFGTFAGSVSSADFFSPENMAAIVSGASLAA
jgi:flavin-dependent dehydrogenase